MKKILILVGIIMMISGITLLSYSIYQDNLCKNEDKENIKEFFEDYEENSNTDEIVEKQETKQVQNTNYIAVIEIPTINLQTGIVMSNASYTTMNRNVSVYPTADMPSVDNGNFILFAHNGSSRVSYFKNINRLKDNDKIYIYYNNNKYTYNVIRKYDVSMYNSSPLNRVENKTIITLITCKSGNNKYRTVIVGELENDR